MHSKYRVEVMSSKFTPIPTGPHNERLEAYAEEKAAWMKSHKTQADVQLISLFKDLDVDYIFKKIIYNRSSGGFIKNYYIVDFYLPKQKLIIETSYIGMSSIEQFKRKAISKMIPGVSFLQWRHDDFSSHVKVEQLKNQLKRQ